MTVIFFLEKNLPQDALRFVEQKIKSSPFVTRVEFVSQEKALERFQGSFPELQDILKNLNTNPFPPSFEATLEEKASAAADIQSYIGEMRTVTGIEDIQYNKDWVEKMESLGQLATAIGFFLGGILLLASFFIISNVIKLNVFARKGEIEILRLVGATNIFIRIPFLSEGIIMGMAGSFLSLLLLFLVIKIFPLYLGNSLGALQDLINFRYLSFSQGIKLVIGGAAVGFLGSLSSLSRFLKI